MATTFDMPYQTISNAGPFQPSAQQPHSTEWLPIQHSQGQASSQSTIQYGPVASSNNQMSSLNSIPLSRSFQSMRSSDAASSSGDSVCETLSSIRTPTRHHTATPPLSVAHGIQRDDAESTGMARTVSAYSQSSEGMNNLSAATLPSPTSNITGAARTSTQQDWRSEGHSSGTTTHKRTASDVANNMTHQQDSRPVQVSTDLPAHGGQEVLCVVPTSRSPLSTSQPEPTAPQVPIAGCYPAKADEWQRQYLPTCYCCCPPQPIYPPPWSTAPPPSAMTPYHSGPYTQQPSYGPLVNYTASQTHSTVQQVQPAQLTDPATLYSQVGTSSGRVQNTAEVPSTPAKPSKAAVPRGRLGKVGKDPRDAWLVEMKQKGMSYKAIKDNGNFAEAESTLRGRFRNLTKDKNTRVRKPTWQDHDVSYLLFHIAARCQYNADHTSPV